MKFQQLKMKLKLSFRLREHGVPHLHGSGKGDEYVRINVLVPEKLNREQRNIIEEMKEGGL